MQIKNIYTNKDGRIRVYCVDEFGKSHTLSYPKILMETKLGRPLEPNEEVHHIDGNPLNNAESNLELVIHGEHQRKYHSNTKYHDKIAVCEVCGNEFVWTAKRQRGYYIDLRRGRKRIISCSQRCSSYYGRQEQLKRNL